MNKTKKMCKDLSPQERKSLVVKKFSMPEQCLIEDGEGIFYSSNGEYKYYLIDSEDITRFPTCYAREQQLLRTDKEKAFDKKKSDWFGFGIFTVVVFMLAFAFFTTIMDKHNETAKPQPESKDAGIDPMTGVMLMQSMGAFD
jgi:hypothetical protein